MSSFALVPWPATMCGWSKGGTSESRAQQQAGARAARALVLRVLHHLGAVAARRLELHLRRVLRHHDHRLDAEDLSRQRHRLRVVAG